jgi:uncharacterized protein (TIGR02145 family)
MVDIPAESKTLTANFISCEDIDNNNYPVVQIGVQVWMAKNLKTTHFSDGTAIPQVTDPHQWTNTNSSAYCWRNNDEATFRDPYGALYNWYSANSGMLCPPGWHVPDESDWTILELYLGGRSLAAGKLKEDGSQHWNSPNTGASNIYEFSMIGGGYRDGRGGQFYELGRGGYLWSAIEEKPTDGRWRGFTNNNIQMDLGFSVKTTGMSVRCLMNDTPPEPDPGTISDYEGNVYKTVTIGKQTWMAENLRNTHLGNGEPIPEVTNASEWDTLYTPGFSWRYNDEARYKIPYGALYNWYAVSATSLCPSGFHIPSEKDFLILEAYLGGRAISGGKLKEEGLGHWDSPNTGASNVTGFTMLPGGYRDGSGSAGYYELGRGGYLWTSVVENAGSGPWYWGFNKDYEQTDRGASKLTTGFSVRCLKDDASEGIPVVRTGQLMNISPRSAVGEGSCLASSLFARGICWSKEPEPDTSDSHTEIWYNNIAWAFTGRMNGLMPQTTYYARAYAINRIGIGYGEAVAFSTLPDSSVEGTITDIEGNIYKTVEIGPQTWMAENLKTTKYNDGTPIQDGNIDGPWESRTNGVYAWYHYDISYKDFYGGVYNWHAVNTDKLCPSAWHVPSDAEWTNLIDYLSENGYGIDGKGVEIAKALAATSGWLNSDFKGAVGNNQLMNNVAGFNGIPMGWRYPDGGWDPDYYGAWWCSDGSVVMKSFSFNSQYVNTRKNDNKGTGVNVRCVKDYSEIVPVLSTSKVTYIAQNTAVSGGTIISSGNGAITHRGICWNTLPAPDTANFTALVFTGSDNYSCQLTGLEPGRTYYVRSFAKNSTGINYGYEKSFVTLRELSDSITDIEGNVYKTVEIGTRKWMAENLKTTHFNDGSSIPYVVDDDDWANLSTPAVSFYNEGGIIIGKDGLYNWYTINTHKLCPAGWHVPNEKELTTLIDYVGRDYGGGALKSTGTLEDGDGLWNEPNFGATNSTGFYGLPGGRRAHSTGGFGFIRGWGYWGVDATNAADASLSLLLYNNMAGVYTEYIDKGDGTTIRCLEDSAGLPSVKTNAAFHITPFSAKGGGTILSDGGSDVISEGICWNTAPHPDTTNMKSSVQPGAISFTLGMENLENNTTYYVRAYALSHQGVSYGNEVSFTTHQEMAFGSVTDFEGNVYKTKKLGEQTWMVENLKSTKNREGVSISEVNEQSAWEQLNSGAFCWYDTNMLYKTDFGALYNFKAVSSGNLCPANWHVPFESDWTRLTNYYGGINKAGPALNETQFNPVSAGIRVNNGFRGIGVMSNNWSSTGEPDHSARGFNLGTDNILQGNTYLETDGLSVRCVKDTIILKPSVLTREVSVITQNSAYADGEIHFDEGSPITIKGFCWNTTPDPDTSDSKITAGAGLGNFNSYISGLIPATTYYIRSFAINSSGVGYGNELTFVSLPAITNGSVSDFEGNVYKTVQIGTQNWMAENLKSTRLNDGTMIPLVTGYTEWPNWNEMAYCWFMNDSAANSFYGALYNYYTVMTNKICPLNWHVPNENEWLVLQHFLGETAVGGKLKEPGTIHWPPPNKGATNSSGFTALPSRTRSDYGGFYINDVGAWWSTTANQYWYVTTESENFFKYGISNRGGISVRCIED